MRNSHQRQRQQAATHVLHHLNLTTQYQPYIQDSKESALLDDMHHFHSDVTFDFPVTLFRKQTAMFFAMILLRNDNKNTTDAYA